MDVQGFVAGFALLVVGLIFGQLIKHHLGWLVLSGLAVIVGTAGLAYSMGHYAGVSVAADVARATLNEVKFGPDVAPLYELPSKIRDRGLDSWLMFVGMTMALFGVVAFVFLFRVYAAIAKKAGEVGKEPKDIKVIYEFD